MPANLPRQNGQEHPGHFAVVFAMRLCYNKDIDSNRAAALLFSIRDNETGEGARS